MLRLTVPPNMGTSRAPTALGPLRADGSSPSHTTSARARTPSTIQVFGPGCSLIEYLLRLLLRDRPQPARVLGDHVQHAVDRHRRGPHLGAQLVGHGDLAH